MNTENNIEVELKGLGSTLIGLPRTMPFAVPLDYFENFNASVKDLLVELNKTEETPEWGKALPYVVPSGYFDDLHNELVSGIATESLQKDIPFNVPGGYFEALPAQMLAAAKVSETKIIPLKRRSILKQIKWAAAAILVLGIGVGSYQAFFNTSQMSGTENILSSVPNNEIQDYIQNNYRVDVDRMVANNSVNNMNLDNKDIVQYLNETGWD